MHRVDKQSARCYRENRRYCFIRVISPVDPPGGGSRTELKRTRYEHIRLSICSSNVPGLSLGQHPVRWKRYMPPVLIISRTSFRLKSYPLKLLRFCTTKNVSLTLSQGRSGSESVFTPGESAAPQSIWQNIETTHQTEGGVAHSQPTFAKTAIINIILAAPQYPLLALKLVRYHNNKHV